MLRMATREGRPGEIGLDERKLASTRGEAVSHDKASLSATFANPAPANGGGAPRSR